MPTTSARVSAEPVKPRTGSGGGPVIVADGSDTGRLTSIDIVRGAIMVLMALDHVRDYVTNVRFRPEDLSQASPALFFTRWVTHFCAPGFFLLAGVGIGLQELRGGTKGRLSRFLVTRGIWLLVLELLITPVGWRFNFELLPAYAVVLWALGWSMILMAAIIHLPRWVVILGSLVMIATHNLFDGVTPQSLGSFGIVWQLLHVPGFAIPGKLLIAYPLIPWIAVMALGYALASSYRWDSDQRRVFFISIGIVATAVFADVRARTTFGDPFPRQHLATIGLTLASYFNVTKYPPSLLFLLMTLGPTLFALAFAEQRDNRFTRWLAVYGRVPMFYYVVHIFVVHATAVLIAHQQGGVWTRIPAVDDPASIPSWYGLSLPGVYAAWAAVVLLMYYPCKWMGTLKATRKNWAWLRYL
jgi:uncharacterized membrane protein